MHEVLVWGIGKAYDNFLRFVDSSKIKINALISSYDEKITSIDGIDIIKPEQIKDFNYEFIVVASQFFDEIVKIGVGGGVNRDKFIPARVFELNGFDIDRYISVKNKNVSIVSDDCWGSLLYNSLGLKFNSPFILAFIEHNSYLKLINNLKYYLDFSLEVPESSKDNLEYNYKNEQKGFYKGYLDNEIEICFSHNNLLQDIKSNWGRRLERFNFDNYIIKMCIYNNKEAYQFEEVKAKNKIGFYWEDKNLKSIFVLNDWKDINTRFKNDFSFDAFVRNTTSYHSDIFNKYFDILKLLNGEKDFKRDIVYK